MSISNGMVMKMLRTSYGEDIFRKEFPVLSVSVDVSPDQPQLQSPTTTLMARLGQIRRLHDEYLAAEEVCKANPADEDARALRDELWIKLKSRLIALSVGDLPTQASD